MKLKLIKWMGLVTLAILPLTSGYSQPPDEPQPPAAPVVNLSPAAGEVVKLAQSGTSDDVILGYIQNSQTPYNLSADDVVYLKDVGVSSPVVTAMLNHDKSSPGQPYVYNQQLYPPTGGQPPPAPIATEPPPVEPPPAPAPAPVPSSAPAPAYVTSTPPPQVNYFYNDLSPYGSWVDLEGYGWCWQPSVVVVNHSWRPYCDSGHWVYSDAGWFWASDYSWGWAPFHYGRWHLHPRCGWVWFPDTTWAPAWVVWRSGGDNCGWAPLPYGATFDARLGFRFNGVSVAAGFDFGLGVNLFTFVGFHDFVGRDYVHHRLPPAEVNRVYHQTTVINNYTINNNHTVVNHGIPVERVSAGAHTTIHTVAVHDLPPGASRPAARGGGEAVVYHHELKAPTRAAAPVVAQRVDDHHPVIQHSSPPSTYGTQRTTPAGTHAPAPTYNPGRTTTVPQTQYTPPPQQHNQPTPPTAPRQPVRTTTTPTTPTTPTTAGSHPIQPTHTPVTTTTTTPTQPTTPRYSPSHSPSTGQTTSPQPAASTIQSPHVYYPKGYYQASTVHMLPPESGAASSSRPSAPVPSSQPTGGSHGQSQGPSQGQGQSKQGPK